ncbi:MAG: ribonuclease T [Pseudomonadota bacterium]
MIKLNQRFRSFFPVIIDVETGGFDASTDALLEVAAVSLRYQGDELCIDESFSAHIDPFEGANIEQSALEFTGIDPTHPFRNAQPEKESLNEMFRFIRKGQKNAACQRSVLVGHNAWFDLSFINAAISRNKIKRSPLHSFTTFDTAALSALALGETVLAKCCQTANIEFSNSEAHSAIYDAKKTAELFCYIVNRWEKLLAKSEMEVPWNLTD